MTTGARRRGSSDPWNFKKVGVFGHFSTDMTFPIQYLMTTFSCDEWGKLTFARDIQTELNFDLMIQRDIDEKRAVENISQYISPIGEKIRTDETVFLPPLLVAVVSSDEANKISQFYPKEVAAVHGAGQDSQVIRTWGNQFQIAHYRADEQTKDSHTILARIDGNNYEGFLIDSSWAEMKFNLADSESDPGSRLVVIDGQHRLFALQHLKKNMREKVENILLPICILFPPNSTEEPLADANTLPSVVKVFRDTFVHVNSTVERVSGHFEILLSDSTLPNIICRSFCDELVKSEEYGTPALALVEWNTKNHKQSFTIAKPYTITSIGPIFELLSEQFKNKRIESGLSALKYLINLPAIREEIDFGEDEDGNKKPIPADFPWRDYQFSHKEILEKAVREEVSPCLIRIFFTINCYAYIFTVFKEMLDDLSKECREGGLKASIAKVVHQNLTEFKPLGDKPEVEIRYQEFIDDFNKKLREKYPEIVRNNVFQKGLLVAWLVFISKLKEFNIRPVDLTVAFVTLVNETLSERLQTFTFNLNHTYLDGSVYDRTRVKPTKKARLQISRLILAFLGNEAIARLVLTKLQEVEPGLGDPEEIVDVMKSMGEEASSDFNGDLLQQRRADFIKNWETDTSLDSEAAEALKEARDELQRAKAEKQDELPETFESLVDQHISDDYRKSVRQLDGILGYATTRNASFSEDEDD